MKKGQKAKADSELLSNYDFSQGDRGKYAKLLRARTNLVLLRPEVAAAFPTAEAVNDALMKIIKRRKADQR